MYPSLPLPLTFRSQLDLSSMLDGYRDNYEIKERNDCNLVT